MKYLRKYNNADKFIEEYGNSDPNIHAIIVSGLTFQFITYYEYDDVCEWGSEYNVESGQYRLFAETYGGRNPRVGDEVTYYIEEEEFEGTIEAVQAAGTLYEEPWVSLCDDDSVVEIKLVCVANPPIYFGGRYVGEEEGLYKWASYTIAYENVPAEPFYYTTVRNPQVGTHVYCSRNGAATDYNCGEVESVKTQRIAYNRKRNWISIGWRPGSSWNFLRINEWDHEFDNSENSTYYVTCADTGVEEVFKGAPLYFDEWYVPSKEVPRWGGYTIDSDGSGGWTIVSLSS